jgi:hypothetical protein
VWGIAEVERERGLIEARVDGVIMLGWQMPDRCGCSE